MHNLAELVMVLDDRLGGTPQYMVIRKDEPMKFKDFILQSSNKAIV